MDNLPTNRANSRARILASVRASLQGARHLPAAPEVTLAPPAVFAPDTLSGTPQSPLVAQFAAELQQLSGTFLSMPAGEVAGWVGQLLAQRGVNEILAWQAADLPVPNLLDELQKGGTTVLDGVLPPDEPGRSQALTRVQAATIGLTGADAAFAETGTLALQAGPGRPRLASLSVRTHIALLDPARLYPSWASWLAAEGPQAAERLTSASNLTLITGPSRTGDIEMTLTVGVHGPGEVIVILVSR